MVASDEALTQSLKLRPDLKYVGLLSPDRVYKNRACQKIFLFIPKKNYLFVNTVEIKINAIFSISKS